MTTSTAQLRLWGTLPPQYKADEIVTSTVDAYDRIITLVATDHSSQALRPYRARIVVSTDAQLTEIEIDELTFEFPMIDALGDGFVIADGRNRGQRGSDDGPQDSARIVAGDGSTQLTFNAGDGIEQLLTDRSGAIWIGYFDQSSIRAPREGNAPSPGAGTVDVCPAGLIRWGEDGRPAWFSAFDPQRNTFWLEVYALNVGLRRTRAYVSTEFPWVEVDQGGIRALRSTPVRGARGIAVAGSTVAFLGRYEDMQSDPRTITVTFARIAGESFEVLTATPLLMPDGSPANDRTSSVVCRDHRIWMQFDDPHNWYVLEIR
jgi:hypothetical protein